MTVAIAVKVSEGLVLAADSALTVEGEVATPQGPPQRGVIQIYSHATKVAQIREWPVGTITWGVGLIGKRTIESLVKEFSNDQPEDQVNSVLDTANSLYKFIEERYKRAFGSERPPLGLQVAGYSPDAFFPEQYLLTFPPSPEGPVVNVRPDNPDSSPNFGANWYGLTDAIVRLYLGFERRAVDALTAAGVAENVAANMPLSIP